MGKKKRTFWIIIAALLVVGSIGIGLSRGDVGIQGEATCGDGSKGVYGKATNTGDVRNYGGFFVADGIRGRGVYGKASNTGDAINYGGFFYASGEQGRGVFGQAAGSSGYGVKGWASDDGDVENYGGHFTATGSKGIGVYGWAEDEGAGEKYGGYFLANGSEGIGVYGEANGSGVYGRHNPTGNYGMLGSEWYGVYGMVDEGKAAVYGRSYAGGALPTIGYLGGRYGVYGETAARDGIAVTGLAIYAGPGAHGQHGGYFAAMGSDYGIGVKALGRGYDFYADGPGINYGAFTGAHEVKLSADFPENVTPGMIVSVTGENQVRQIDGKNISFSSTLPTVQLSDTPNDSKVLGVFISESPLPEEHWYINESIEGDRFGIVNALGEGRVWVIDINGDIEAGDYITTSLVAGYGQKQDDDLLHSYTLGKAIESVNWSNVSMTVEFNGQTYRAYPIAVVYTSG